MNELFLFVRPPRPLWPFNGPASAFWPPLAFASLAASLRARVRDLRVAILDAPAWQMGWRTLEGEIRRLQPAFVGMGEEAVSCVEGFRLARLAKAVGAQVIAGGCFFSHVAPQVLQGGWVDAVVHGEGEITIVELVEALRDSSAETLSQVPGISFIQDGQVITTPSRPLLPDLDQLPFPAYDLLPTHRYGRHSRNHPDLAAIELGRGCVGSCEFCVLWRQMAEMRGGQPASRLRLKSPERLVAEVEWLIQQHHRRYLGWIDPCFNADSTVPAQMAERLLKKDIRIGQSAWVRADGIVRDAASGALNACVEAGLNEIYLGIERSDAEGLRTFRKSTRLEEVRTALHLIAEQYPQVFTVGSFIYGLPGDTAATMRAMYRVSVELELDKAFFIPLTPLPGTPYWRPELWDPSGERFRGFDFLPPSPRNSAHPALERALFWSFVLDWNGARLGSYLRGFFSADSRRRRLTRRLFARATRFSAGRLRRALSGSTTPGGMVFPKWYES